MSLSGIFNPEVRAYFNGCGSAVDGIEFCISWRGYISAGDRPMIDLSELGMKNKFYKVSDKILSTEELHDSIAVLAMISLDGSGGRQVEVINETFSGEGWEAGMIDGNPFVLSGTAGVHRYMGFDIVFPSDGTYFMRADGEVMVYLECLYKQTLTE